MSSHKSSASKQSARLRVGTFNVHQWTNGNSENTFDDICNLLCEANLDIIGLQEASSALLPGLLSMLGKDQYELAAKFGGTAILTRLPIVHRSKPGKGRYICCSVILPGGTDEQPPFSVIAVHLDHKKEQKRIKEIQTIIQDLEKKGLPLFDLWMGDFNALTRADYTKREWDHIFHVRNRNNWELNFSDLTLAMTSKAKPPSMGMGLHDAYASVPGSRRSGPLSTCRFETRIDYVFFNAQRMDAAGWTIVSCEHVDSAKVSDHNLVIATFEKR